jgi:hypothetical protein
VPDSGHTLQRHPELAGDDQARPDRWRKQAELQEGERK